MLSGPPPCKLERWYSHYASLARYDLSSSAAPSLTIKALLALAGPETRDEFLELDLHYGPPQGLLRLRTAIADQYAALCERDIQLATGASEAIFLVLSACIRPGDVAIVQAPIYPAVEMITRALHAHVRPWPFGPNGHVDLDHLESLLRQEPVRIVAINNPHSPTGVVLSEAEIATIARLTAAHGATLMVDEVYHGIQFAGDILPSAADLGPHVVSIGDLAKPYGLGGLRIGWIATVNQSLLKRCMELRAYTSLCGTIPGEFLGALALKHRTVILESNLSVARRNRALFADAMRDVAWLDWRLADGGFTIFPRTDLPTPTATWCKDLRERYDVLLLPGEVYDRPGYVRLGFGVEPSHFERGLERLVAYASA